MKKNYNHFKSIKKAFALVAFVGTLTSVNSVFATKQTSPHVKRFSAPYHIAQIENCVSDYQMKLYIENLSNDDLENLYVQIFKKRYSYAHNQKLLQARLIISKEQVQRALASVANDKKKQTSKTSERPLKQVATTSRVSSKKTAPHKTSTEPTLSEEQPDTPHKQIAETFKKGKSAKIRMHVCQCCKQRRPIDSKSVVSSCTICGKDCMQYVCEECMAEKCAKALAGKSRTRKKCRHCLQQQKASKNQSTDSVSQTLSSKNT